jgi:hypothetical protein
MFETLLSQLLQTIIVPEIANFIKKRFESTGNFPTEDELRVKVNTLAEDIKREGFAFLNRVEVVEPKVQVHVNKADNTD